MSTIFHRLLNHNIEELNLFGIDVSSPFNHFTILLYYSIPSIKPCSKMDWHSDIKYYIQGIYKRGFNSQRDNTPTVVYSVGGVRAIQFRRMILTSNKFFIDDSFKHVFKKTNGSVLIVKQVMNEDRMVSNFSTVTSMYVMITLLLVLLLEY